MRSLLLLILLGAILVRTVGAAHAGVLGWTWLTLMTPQKLVWGFATNVPLNLILAIVTLVAWFASRESKRLPMNGAVVLWLAFIVFITFTTFLALAPDLAWAAWSRTIKVMLLGLMVATIMTSQVRIHSLVWIIVLSLGFFGVKGGVFTLVSGGYSSVLPAEESLGDNNNLALALCMILPLMNYLRLQSANRFVRLGAAAAMTLTVFGIFGTYSRGGLIGLAIMLPYLWWHSKNRIVIALVVLAVSVPAYTFMPAKWTERMSTIQTAEEDASFQDRLYAWRTEFNIAKARPLTGGGFNASLSPRVYEAFSGNPSYRGGHAAHSIYFEVLGDHGFIGLALYLGLLLFTWRYAGATRRRARRDPQNAWIADLAAMIQVSLVTFLVAGAALSMAYYDVFYLLLGTSIALRKIVSQEHVSTNDAVQPLAFPTSVPRGG